MSANKLMLKISKLFISYKLKYIPENIKIQKNPTYIKTKDQWKLWLLFLNKLFFSCLKVPLKKSLAVK